MGSKTLYRRLEALARRFWINLFNFAKARSTLWSRAMRQPQHPDYPSGRQSQQFLDNDFQFIRTLGQGGFGRVCLAIHRPTGEKYAVKIHRKPYLKEMNHFENITREQNIHGILAHPCIIPMFGHFETEDSISFVLEPCLGGDLHRHIRKAGRLDMRTARMYAARVCLAIEHMHDKDICYRDVKPENCILDSDGNLKVADFGWAKYLGKNGRTNTLCGTPEYTAPEIISMEGYGKAVDWWSLGILVFEMLAGHPPFRDAEPLRIYEQILHGRPAYEAIAEQPSIESRHAIMIMKQLLSREPEIRVQETSGLRDAMWFSGFDWRAML